MRIVSLVGEAFQVCLSAPGILSPIFTFPMNCGFLACFVAFDSPLSGPGETFSFDVGALFHRLRSGELRCGRAADWPNRQQELRPFLPTELKRRGHWVRTG